MGKKQAAPCPTTCQTAGQIPWQAGREETAAWRTASQTDAQLASRLGSWPRSRANSKALSMPGFTLNFQGSVSKKVWKRLIRKAHKMGVLRSAKAL